MDKNNNKLLTAGKTLVLILLLLDFHSGFAQKLYKTKGYCGLYYQNMEDLYRAKQGELDFYNFLPGQNVGSIGAQCGHWEAGFAASTDSIHFYLEDIDTTYFNQRQIGFAWHYYDSIRGRPMTCPYTLVLGTEKVTMLPQNNFDKIIIINSIHEFTYLDEMLGDIKSKLKKDGILYIDEAVPRYEGEVHGVCRKPMITQEQMIEMLSRNGFDLSDVMDIKFRKNKVYRKIYAFQKR